jgi:hypothetical protein
VNRARAALLVGALLTAVFVPPLVAAANAAPSLRGTDPVRRAVVFVVPGMPFATAMGVPAFRQLARAGGAGLMTTAVPSGGGRGSSSYLTVGAGTPLADAAAPERALMMQALGASGVACSADPGHPLDLMVETAGAGGPCVPGFRPSSPGLGAIEVHALAGVPRALGAAVRASVRRLAPVRTLVVVVAPTPSPAMDAAGDEVTPLFVADGLPAGLFPVNGPMHGLTSSSTRRDGLVSNTDVATTALRAFGVPVPSEMNGNPIGVTDGPAPFALSRLQLQHRRIRFPVQMIELGLVVAAGLVAIGALLWVNARGGISPGAAAAVRFMGVAGMALPLVLLAGGWLPRLTYGFVIPYLVLGPVALAALATYVRWPGPYPAFGFIGALGLGFFALDLLTGAHALRVPLQGGVMFDGVRFFGMPNFAISPLLASALFVAAGLATGWGTALLLAAGLMAGWPSLGADVGGSITLFVAAGLWFAIRRAGGRLRPSGLVVTALVAVGGLTIVLLANRFLAGSPTHGTRFVERTTASFGTLFATIADRLGLGVRLVASDLAVLIPLVGLVVILWLAVRRPGRLVVGLADDRWRDTVGVLAGAALLSYMVNDTGSTAASPAFLYGMVAILVPTVTAFAGGRSGAVGSAEATAERSRADRPGGSGRRREAGEVGRGLGTGR